MRNILSILFLFVIGSYAYAQKKIYMTGLPPDDGRYDKLPQKAELLTRSYTTLPSKHSLMQYCPEVRSQRQHGTCTSWATVYAARTIAEAVKYGWTDKKKVTNEAFSPIFVYAQTKEKSDKDCQRGIYINDALEFMKNKGVAKFLSFPELCANFVNNDLKAEATHFKINGYFTLFSLGCKNSAIKISKVKKSLCEDRPVVIAMWLPQSFFEAYNNNNWNGVADVDPSKHGYHAMCVVGYDNDVEGGSFQIMNSWGEEWGNNGFIWVKYNDFAKYVDQAYEVYVKKEIPKPVPEPKKYTMDGEMKIASHNGTIPMPVVYSEQGKVPHYVTKENYLSGTKFRLYINNRKPAWVYVIASDLKNDVTKLFPYNDVVSAYMNYSENNFAIPDEQHEFEFDTTAGTDYFCVLYSQEELNINSIVTQLKQANGTFYQKLTTVLGKKAVPQQDVRYIQNSMGFSAKSNQTIVPLVVEIPHKGININN